MAIGMVPPDKTGFFFDLARELAADLVKTPVPEDELDRAKLPVIQMIARMSSGNMFWMNQTQGGTRDPARLAAIPGIINDIRATTPAELQALAAKYLVPAKDWSMQVLPEKK